MKLIKLTPQARADLDGIWAYTAETWNIDQAEAYLLGLDSTLKLLTAHPKLGRQLATNHAKQNRSPIKRCGSNFRLRPKSKAQRAWSLSAEDLPVRLSATIS